MSEVGGLVNFFLAFLFQLYAQLCLCAFLLVLLSGFALIFKIYIVGTKWFTMLIIP